MRSMPTDASLMQLQQEALSRVRQMQQRARETVQSSEGFTTPSFARSIPQPEQPTPVAQATPLPIAPAQTVPPQNNDPSPSPDTAPFPPRPNPGGGRPPFGQQRPNNGRSQQGDSILSQLFGGGRTPGRTGSPTQPKQQGDGAAAAPAAHSAGGLLDLIRGGLSGSATSGLGDTLRGTISSASKPLSDLLDAFSIDGEKLLILLVMWVIFNERSDNKTLLLALGYLLL